MNPAPDDSIAFFRAKFDEIDAYAEEICYNQRKIEEIFYKVSTTYPLPFEHSRHYRIIKDSFFPDINDEEVDAFSYQKADGVVYSEDKIMLMLRGSTPLRANCYGVSCIDPLRDYCINHNVESGRRKYKFYDRSIVTPIEIPNGFRYESKFGVGVTDDENIIGCYLVGKDFNEIARFYGLEKPIDIDVSCQDTLFGVTYCTARKRALKLSSYQYTNPIIRHNRE